MNTQNQRLIDLYKLEYLNIPNDETAEKVLRLVSEIKVEKAIPDVSYKEYMLNKLA